MTNNNLPEKRCLNKTQARPLVCGWFFIPNKRINFNLILLIKIKHRFCSLTHKYTHFVEEH